MKEDLILMHYFFCYSVLKCCSLFRILLVLNSECAPHTRCSFLWSIVKIATGHVHDSKQTRVKTAHFSPAMCNLAHWLIRHGSPTIHRCFALPQLLYRWRHQSEKIWIPPRIFYSHQQNKYSTSEYRIIRQDYHYKRVINNCQTMTYRSNIMQYETDDT
jgi:hypothetical protein